LCSARISARTASAHSRVSRAESVAFSRVVSCTQVRLYYMCERVRARCIWLCRAPVSGRVSQARQSIPWAVESCPFSSVLCLYTFFVCDTGIHTEHPRVESQEFKKRNQQPHEGSVITVCSTPPPFHSTHNGPHVSSTLNPRVAVCEF
jgi:hypothetical protein